MVPPTLVSDWFDERFRLNDLVILTTEHWIVSLRPEQPTLGSLVLSLRRPCESLGGIDPGEAGDLSRAFSTITRLLQGTFEPDKINYLALMMVDPHVHFHVIPRYEQARSFAGLEFQDAGWPGPPVLSPVDLTETVRLEILAALGGSTGAS